MGRDGGVGYSEWGGGGGEIGRGLTEGRVSTPSVKPM